MKRSRKILLLVTIFFVLVCQPALLKGKERLCKEGGQFEKVELVPGLDLTGDGLPDRVELLYRDNSNRPVLARLSIGEQPPVLAAPDRLILGFDGPMQISALKEIFNADGDGTSNPGEFLGAQDLEGGAWLLTLVPGLPVPSFLDGQEKQVFPKAPGLALISALTRVGPHTEPGGHVLRSASIDRLIALEKHSVLPSTVAVLPTTPVCLARQGATTLEDPEPQRWWTHPVPVAIVDSGIDDHNGLRRILWSDAVDTSSLGQVVFGTMTSKPCEVGCDIPLGHGTSVAGGAASSTLGVAPNTPLIPIRVFDDEGCGWSSSIIKGLYQAARKAPLVVLAWTFSAADVPRCPRGDTIRGDEICQAIRASPEVLFLAAAGNERKDLISHPFYPSAWAGELTNLLVVGGVNRQDGWASNMGKDFVHLAGIAGRCQMIIPGDDTLFGDGGTSLATGFTAGAAALYWAKNPKVFALDVKDALSRSARFYGTNVYGNCCRNCGVLDVSNALGRGATTVAQSQAECPP